MKKHTLMLAVLALALVSIKSPLSKHKIQTANQASAQVTPAAEEAPPVQPVQLPAPAPAPAPLTSPAPTSEPAPAQKTSPAPAPAPVSKPRPAAYGSNANPAPKAISNVASVPTLKFASCTETSFSQKFLCLINNYRAENGKKALVYDGTLNKVAADYSAYMNSAHFFAHVAPDGSHYYERCAAAGTVCHGENLAMGFLSAQNLFDMWRSSPSHNANMLGPYSSMGLGISGDYATNLFRW